MFCNYPHVTHCCFSDYYQIITTKRNKQTKLPSITMIIGWKWLFQKTIRCSSTSTYCCIPPLYQFTFNEIQINVYTPIETRARVCSSFPYNPTTFPSSRSINSINNFPCGLQNRWLESQHSKKWQIVALDSFTYNRTSANTKVKVFVPNVKKATQKGLKFIGANIHSHIKNSKSGLWSFYAASCIKKCVTDNYTAINTPSWWASGRST